MRENKRPREKKTWTPSRFQESPAWGCAEERTWRRASDIVSGRPLARAGLIDVAGSEPTPSMCVGSGEKFVTSL